MDVSDVCARVNVAHSIGGDSAYAAVQQLLPGDEGAGAGC